MEVRKLDRGSMTFEYGAHVQRLVPWSLLNAPFQGAWCVLAPGAATEPHAHHEYEIFIAVSGTAVVESQGQRSDFVAGDVVHLPPGELHTVVNAGQDDFQFYSVWWDAEMSGEFSTRHNADLAAGQVIGA